MSQLSHEDLNNSKKIHPRLHAKYLDKSLGFRISKIEVKLLQKYRAYDQNCDLSSRKQHFIGTQAWIGLHPQALQTPYCDIYEALNSLMDFKIEHVVDIGAGYGRVGVTLSVVHPKAKFIGFEIVKLRQAEGNRIFKKLGIINSEIHLKNVLDADFELPLAEVYFIYDFSEQEDITQVLLTLSLRVQEKDFYLITKGDRVDYLLKYKFQHIWKIFTTFKSSDLKIYAPKKLLKR